MLALRDGLRTIALGGGRVWRRLGRPPPKAMVRRRGIRWGAGAGDHSSFNKVYFHIFDPTAMRGVQIGVARVTIVHGEPNRCARLCVVARFEPLHHHTKLRRAVEVEGSCLHPCIVGVARVIDATTVDHLTIAKEIFRHLFEAYFICLILKGGGLLLELALGRL